MFFLITINKSFFAWRIFKNFLLFYFYGSYFLILFFFIIFLLSVLFMNGYWFPLTYLFFGGECLCNTSPQILKNLSKLLSFLLISVTEIWFTRFSLKKLICKILVISVVHYFRSKFTEVCFHKILLPFCENQIVLSRLQWYFGNNGEN